MGRDIVRKLADWEKLKGMVKNIKQGDLGQQRWYDGLAGGATYDKLMILRVQCLKDAQQGKWVTRWWDDEVSAQYKAVPKARMVELDLRARVHDGARVQAWETEKTNRRG